MLIREALAEFTLSQHAEGQTLSPLQRTVMLAFLAEYFWSWYREHAGDVVVEVRVWFLTKTIRVRDLYPVWTRLFGEEPTTI